MALTSEPKRVIGGCRRAALLAAASVLWALLVPAAGAAAVPHLRLGSARVGAARRFWTAARMERARPLPALAFPGGQAAAGAVAETSASVPPTLASSTLVTDPTAPVLRRNGAIFLSAGPGEGFARCSGTSVSAANLSLVFTAGHCVFDEGRWWARHWVFVPAYRYGERPFGTFVAKWLGTTPGWHSSANFNYDVGVAVVGRNERGQRLGAAVGADKVAFDRSPAQRFDVYGYPVARPFDGSGLRVCSQAPYVGHDLEAFYLPGPLELGVSCEISPGSSGGGWVIDGETLDGVTSNGYPDDPTTDYGPYFGSVVKKLYRRAARVR